MDLLAVQGTLKCFFQHHNLKASILWCSVLFTVQLSHLYMTTGKTIALTIRTFVSKVMSLLFNILSRFVIAFLSRSKRLLEVMVSTLDSEFSYKWNHDMISFFKVFSPLNSVLSPSMQFDVHYFSLLIIFHSIDLKKKVIHDNCSRW